MAVPERLPCLATEGCLFILFISRNEILRLILPTPDFSIAASSPTIFCVLGRAFGRLGTTAPAPKLRSVRKESRSVANFRSALSKSISLRGPVPLIWIPLIVVLLLLLSVPFLSGVILIDWMDRRASSESRDSR